MASSSTVGQQYLCNEMSKENFETSSSCGSPINLGPFEDINADNNVVEGGTGVYLTWEDLMVTVSSSSSGKKEYYGGTTSTKTIILQGITGYACPGQVLAILGPSGCGKSTLLDALAGRLSSRTRQKGEILINGQKQKLAYGTSAYVTQEDTLTWTLTVREAVYYSAQLQLPATMSRADKKERAERTIREMGLQDSMDTRIGGWGRKGLSGGQKRRVSICIELLRRPKLLFLDEPTSGLDSAASYFVMNKIVKLAREYGMTVLSSIHQPASEVFQLLHDLCLLSSGRMVYFGPSCSANEFFSMNGFACPALQNPADHYLKLINTDFEEDIEWGNESRFTAEEVINQLIRSYSSSDTYEQVKKLVAEIRKRDGGSSQEEEIKANLFTQSVILTKRSFLNMHRDPGYYWLRLAIYVAMCLGLGSVFYNLGSSYSSIHERGALLMFVASLLTLMAIGGFPSFVEDLKVFRRERLNGHYGVAAFVVANTVSSMPFLLIISAVPGAVTYFLAGLHHGNVEFAFFTLSLFVSMMLVESLMMIVASVMPNFLLGLIVGAGIQGLMMLSGGFYQLPEDLPKVFWKYPMYYIAFHKYAYQGLYKNEFEGLRFTNDQLGGPPTIDGEDILRDIWQVDMAYCKWIDLEILFGMVVVYRVLLFVTVKIGEKINSTVGFTLSSLVPEQEEKSS